MGRDLISVSQEATQASDTPIREVIVTVTWPESRGHSLDDAFAEAEGVDLRMIRSATVSVDGRYNQLVELDGDVDGAQAVLEDCPAVLDYDVVGGGGDGVAYMQCRTNGLVEDLQTREDYDVIVDLPIYYLDDEPGQRWRLIGAPQAITDYLDTLPEYVSIELDRKGPVGPGSDPLPDPLTDRQYELLTVAVSGGYYEVPRELTQAELAERLDLSPGTVSEHLQRIEAKLAAGYLHAGPE